MTFQVGEVISINGVKVTLKIYDEFNKDTLFFLGKTFKGISIREYISIQRGFRDIICIIEGEYLDEKFFEKNGNKIQYIRKVEVRPIGYFEGGKFYEGIKYLPMIKDGAFLIEEGKIKNIYSEGSTSNFVIGEMLKEEIPISLSWQKVFNTHIGIFGNTGSGKSNTLAKLYTVLFNEKLEEIGDSSKFVLLDFNGEYTNNQLTTSENKTVLNLNTNNAGGEDKFPISENEFWNDETLGILFQATTNTQKPFLNRVINGRKRFQANADSLSTYTKKIIEKVFTSSSPKPENLNLIKSLSRTFGWEDFSSKLNKIVSLTSKDSSSFAVEGSAGQSRIYFNENATGYNEYLKSTVDVINVLNLNPFEELTLRINLQLINDLLHGYVQFEHIQPLLKRIDSYSAELQKVLDLENEDQNSKILTVISLRKCNQRIKKTLPLLIAKHYYAKHKNSVSTPVNKTLHLIIDEAHNILSKDSFNEHETWKDYRLELFEEIIKEGRKFGMFLTLSSQRPADISPTIVSQIHNFFIHRLVNDRDLYLLDNTISTLDKISKSLIPNLSKGCCVVTGTSFDIPMVLQIYMLDESFRPDSDDVDLNRIWFRSNMNDLLE